MADEKSIPLCPLMSVGSQVEIVCMQENCAWYLKNYKINGVTDAQIDNLLKIYQEEWKN